MASSWREALDLLPLAGAAVIDGVVVAANEPFRKLFGEVVTFSAAAIGIASDLLSTPDGRLRRSALVTAAGGRVDGVVGAVAREDPESGSVVIVTLVPDAMLPAEDRELREFARFPMVNPAPVLRIDRDARVVACNPAAEQLFGDVKLPLSLWTEVCPGVDAGFWQRVLEDKPPPSIEVALGKESVRFDHVRPPGTNVVTAFGVITTDFRRAEQALNEKASELAELARFPDMNPGPVIRTDFEGQIRLANAAAQAVFGTTLLHRNWMDVCPKVDQASWRIIQSAPESVPVEVRVGANDFVFNHRSDPTSRLVFIYGTDVTRQKQAEQALRQSEKMATLGTLAAGVTHELNNPAAATRRAADQLKDKLVALEEAHLRFNPGAQPPEIKERLKTLLTDVRRTAGKTGETDAMAQADREMEVEDWLDERGVGDAWELAPALVSAGLTTEALSPLAEGLEGSELAAALAWASATYDIASLTHTVSQGASRLSEIVKALKGYSYLGQAPIQDVDLTEGIENTLVILRSKLKYGITVHRDYAADMPLVPAYGSELNQVWTNIIDNAADAMGEKGEITIRVRTEGGFAIVEIEDNGPGVPPEIQGRLFDPFFTTKAPGKGMGLGLSTSYSIITDKHHGQLTLESEPGRTRFTTRLPLTAATGTTSGQGHK